MIPLSFPYRDMGMIRESYTLHSTKNAGIDTQLLYDGKKVISADMTFVLTHNFQVCSILPETILIEVTGDVHIAEIAEDEVQFRMGE